MDLKHEVVHSSEEDPCDVESAELAETYGTPPTRLNAIKPLRKLASKKSKKQPDREVAQAKREKDNTQRRQCAKAQARKQARAFKSLDTTVHVLGIQAKQGEQDTLGEAAEGSRAAAKIHKVLSAASSDTSEAGSKPVQQTPRSKPQRVQSVRALDVQTQPGAPRTPSTPILAQGGLREVSGEYSSLSDLSELMSARQEWHAVLDDVLEGTHEDLEPIMSSASGKAQDLRDQLIMWQTPPEPTWPARQQHLNWLDIAMADVKEIFTGLRRHWYILEQQGRIREAMDLMQDVAQELCAMATMCCDSVKEGLHSIQPISLLDVRLGFTMQRDTLHRLLKLVHKIASGITTSNGPALGQALGRAALEVVLAGFDATARLQEAVLCPEALTGNLGGISAHETNERARQLQSCWEECGHATLAITGAWPQLRPELHREWCRMYLRAARAAEDMQAPSCTLNRTNAAASSSSEEELACQMDCTGGVWGRSPADTSSVPSVSDEDLQAQAWFPGILTSMLHCAETAANVVLNESGMVEFEGEEYLVEPDPDVEDLVDSMSAAFYSLAATGTVRVGRLCKAPQLLSCWALELLEEQACNAILFVRDLDTSLLGQNELGLENFDHLRKCTDELVNAILHVRQLLKRRRQLSGADGDCAPPNPRALAAAKVVPSARFSPNTSPYGRVPPAVIAPPANLSRRKPIGSFGQQPINKSQMFVPRNSQLTASLRGSNAAASKPPVRHMRQAETVRPAKQAYQQTPRQTAADGFGQQRLQATSSSHDAAQNSPGCQQTNWALQQKQPLIRDEDAHRLPSVSAQSNRGVGHSLQTGHAASSGDGRPGPAAQQVAGQPAKPSYASRVAMNGPPQASALPGQPHHRNRHKHHYHKGKGRPQPDGYSDVAILATQPPQASAGAESLTAVPAAARNTVAAPIATAPGNEASGSCQIRQPSAGLQASTQGSDQHLRHQQHPPFRDTPAYMHQSPFLLTGDDSPSAETSLGAENRDPALQQQGMIQKPDLTPVRPSFMASPFTALNTLPSFTKPLSPSKALEFPSAFGSQRGSEQQDAAPSSPNDTQTCRHGSPVHPKGQQLNSAAEASQRATAPPGARDTTTSGHPQPNAPSSPSSSASSQQQPPTMADVAALNGNITGQHKHAEPPSPTTPLALASTSDGIAKKESVGKAPSTCSDLGFSLLWDDDPFWQLRWEEIQRTLIRQLGKGSFGHVFEGWYHSAPMAVKVMNVDCCTGLSTRTLQLFKAEVDLQRKLSFHPNIVRFIGACCQIPQQMIAEPMSPQEQPYLRADSLDTSGVKLAIVMELCRFGTFYHLIEQARRVAHLPADVRSGSKAPRSAEEAKLKVSPGWRLYHDWPRRLELAHQAAAAVEFMHSHNVVHRDLTSNNLLVTDKWEAKVGDFNLSRAMKTDTVEPSATMNSPAWSAPERLQGLRYGKSADVFSFGVILWELITLGVPWRDMGDDGTIDDSRDNFYHILNNVISGNQLPCPLAVEPVLPELPQLTTLMERCWKKDPVQRPCMAEVAQTMHTISQVVKRRVTQEHRQSAHANGHA